ncbi:MAG: 4Fe-4S binding protein [Armatimonadota bacterium]|nr:4Fe-4S binding protein [Armatimonadota bacterium]MDR7440099.1 4Fe-4S binding protein [Armatimonadota bacterium]MDR7563587.1 4Fe-4S binding protein [Armatimonadota bacterium]MDR7567803.1 4Fe-4S binding protein [Armatimonadota bacterium]MDR7602199.1 4Fe-4S binding protein [Armatimonadota bacterium]
MIRTLVGLCGNLGEAAGVDLSALARGIGGTGAEVAVRVFEDLCRRPQGLGQAVEAEGAGRVVLGLCGREYEERTVQIEMREAGLDPLGLAAVDLSKWCSGLPRELATEKAKILLASAVAAVQAFPGSTVANAKPCFPDRLSRRSFLQLPLPVYRPVPSVVRDRCRAEVGCRLCVQACPYQALSIRDGRLRLDRTRCEGCGLCLPTCPREALFFPGYTPREVEARIRTLLDPQGGGIEPRGILFVCPHAERTTLLHPGWMPVELPCVAMAPPSWLVAPLWLGARAVGVLPCCGGCPADHVETVHGRVAFCQQLLERVGGRPESVQFPPPLDQPPGNGRPEISGRAGRGVSFEAHPQAVTSTLLGFLEFISAEEEVVFEHPSSPVGVVEIASEVCTACGMCARTCPTGALTFEESDGQVRLAFDAARCTACGLCLPPCPEQERGAIRVRRRFDSRRLRAGRVPVVWESVARCAACGAPIAPERMLARVTALLEDGHPHLRQVLGRYCSSCRPLWSSRGKVADG